MEKLLLLLIPAAAVIGAIMAGVSMKEARKQHCDEVQDIPLRDENPGVSDAETIEEIQSSQLVRAEIRRVKHDMNPVTLSSWTRIVCDCEDGVERKMSFDGENGMYLSEGDTGMLEHRDGVFVSFEKDSGEVVAPLYHIPAEEK